MSVPRSWSRDERAEIGNSALLLFVACIVVAAATTGTFLAQASSFTRHATEVSHTAAAADATRISVLSMVGHRSAPGGDLETFDAYLAVSSRGPTVNFAQATLYVEVADGVRSLSYVDGAASATQYSMEAVRDADSGFSTSDPVLGEGDTAQLTFDLDASGIALAPNGDLKLRIEPDHAEPVSFHVRAPATFGSALTIELA